MSKTSPNFGRYRLIAEVGRGGMATVYLALTENANGVDFNKLVVIKRLREHVATDPEFVTMLRDEARLAARLNHQNVVTTIEVGEHEGELFLAMEFLDGQPLHRITRRSDATFTLPMHLTILSDVLAGMHYAHDLRDFDGTPLSIVHRDITPHNIFVTYDGQVKILDFGIAKAAGRASETKHGVVKGKVTYMAPEQARGEILDRRTDIFAAGIMLFEACTRQRFWEGFSEHQMLRALVRGQHPRSPIERVPSIDIELDAICQKALAPLPADRYATAEDFAIELDEYMRVKAPRVRARVLGSWLSELFADKRTLTQSMLGQQIEELRGRLSTQTIILLPNDRTTQEEDDPDFKGADVYAEASSFSSQQTNKMAAETVSRNLPATDKIPRQKASSKSNTRLLLLGGVALIALLVLCVAVFNWTREMAESRPPAPSTTAH